MMEIDRDKAIKLVIVVIITIAGLALMNVAIQLIQTILPFLIVAGGVYTGYRWVLSDSAAPTEDEVREQARGLFSRFRRTKEAAETVMKVGSVMSDLQGKANKETKKAQPADVVQGEVIKKEAPKAQAESEMVAEPEEAEETIDEPEETEEVVDPKKSYKNELEESDGAIEFNDKDVVIDTSKDLVQPDTSRLEEKEKEVPQVTNDVLAQIEARRRRLQEGKE